MKCVFILFVIGIFGLGIFAVEPNDTTLALVIEGNQNIRKSLKLKVVKILDNEIEKNTSVSAIQTLFAKAKEDALNEFNDSKIGSGPDLVDRYYNELKRGLDALNNSFYKSVNLFNRAVAYYKNYITVLMLTNTPKAAHDETKNRAIAEFERKARNGNDLYDAFKHKLSKELDLQFQWTFPGIVTNKNGTNGGWNNNNTATLGSTTTTNNPKEATTTEISKKKDN